jgi:RNA polymerase sigma-70 factor (ECF subfamily)
VIKPTVSFPESIADEASLVSSAQRDPAEFAALYDRYFRQVYHYLYSRVGHAAEAEDLTAQTFLAALEALPYYGSRGHFAA